VLAHARALLVSREAGVTDYVDADLRDTGTILAQARRLLDFTQPVAVTLIAILHAIPDSDDPHAIVAALMDAVPPGSYLALSHMGKDLLDGETEGGLTGIANRMMRQKLAARSREQVLRFFDGTDLVPPGVTGSSNGARTPRPTRRPGHPCGAARAASAEARGASPGRRRSSRSCARQNGASSGRRAMAGR
jgi:hypothetical protein